MRRWSDSMVKVIVQKEDTMKIKSLGLLLLTMVICDSCLYAAGKRPSKVGQEVRMQSKEAHKKLRQLFTEIAGANIAQVKMLLEDEEIKKLLNEHDGTFSPLGKVDDELEKNKNSSLEKAPKTARAKALMKIRELLQANGATMIFRSTDVDKEINKKKVGHQRSCKKNA